MCFVMAYSFSDDEESDVCSRTMMVPFVDLLNHHSKHHAELRFYPDRLELVAIRSIDKVWWLMVLEYFKALMTCAEGGRGHEHLRCSSKC